jgi:hypothetical protein
VINAHDFSHASGITIIVESIAIIRLRCGKVYFFGSTSESYSDTNKPHVLIIDVHNACFVEDKYRSIPPASTMIVGTHSSNDA